MRGLAHTLDVLAIEQRVAALGGHAHFGKGWLLEIFDSLNAHVCQDSEP